MMGTKEPQKELFSYSVDLDKRVRPEHPLRRVQELVDFTFVRGEVRGCYGYNGHESVDPAIIMKMMFLLFLDNVPSERELMKIIRERLDYLWFLGYGLDDEVPDHSVLSKARRRWGSEVFEKLFVRIVGQCVEAGLVGGEKIHMDGSLVDANASKNSILKGSEEMIAKIREIYRSEAQKLDEEEELARGVKYHETVNDKTVSKTDPDASLVRKDGDSRPRYKSHRVIDDSKGVITAVISTPGSIKENGKLMDLVEAHERNTGSEVETVVADRQYGTAENFRTCQERGINTHMGDMLEPQVKKGRREGVFGYEDFIYDPETDTLTCPAGQTLARRKHKTTRKAYEYACAMGICKTCAIRAQCTRAKSGIARTVKRHYHHEAVEAGRAQSQTPAAKRDRVRRKWLMEGSFADAANNHGFKRARWRRLWRQKIQDYMIATVQNIRILLRYQAPIQNADAQAINARLCTCFSAIFHALPRIHADISSAFDLMLRRLRSINLMCPVRQEVF